MTTRTRQKFSSILALVSIIAILLSLVLLWTAVHNGIFSDNNINESQQSYDFEPINSNDAGLSSTISTNLNHTIHHHGHHMHHQHHQHHDSMTPSGKLLLFVTNYLALAEFDLKKKETKQNKFVSKSLCILKVSGLSIDSTINFRNYFFFFCYCCSQNICDVTFNFQFYIFESKNENETTYFMVFYNFYDFR